MKEKILITGSAGVIGKNLYSFLKDGNYDVFGIDIIENEYSVQKLLDITDKIAFLELLNDVNPEVIIHTAAIKDMKTCQENEKSAFEANVEPSNTILSYLEQNSKCRCIYISSDIVFNGLKGNYSEKDKTDPINIYGKTKLQSENILKKCKRVSICRTALVLDYIGSFDIIPIALEKELLKDILLNQSLLIKFVYHKLKRGEEIFLSDEHISNPTPVPLLNILIEKVISQGIYGKLHTAGPIQVSRLDFALKVAEIFNLDESLIKISSTAGMLEYRPKNVSMNIDDTYNKLKIRKEDWSLEKIIKILSS